MPREAIDSPRYRHAARSPTPRPFTSRSSSCATEDLLDGEAYEQVDAVEAQLDELDEKWKKDGAVTLSPKKSRRRSSMRAMPVPSSFQDSISTLAQSLITYESATSQPSTFSAVNALSQLRYAQDEAIQELFRFASELSGVELDAKKMAKLCSRREETSLLGAKNVVTTTPPQSQPPTIVSRPIASEAFSIWDFETRQRLQRMLKQPSDHHESSSPKLDIRDMLQRLSLLEDKVAGLEGRG